MRWARLAAVLLLAPSAAHADDRSEENDVLVHIDGPRASTLERFDGSEWIQECSAPCDLRLPATGRRRVTGRGIADSDPFTLTASAGGDETIDVRGGSTVRSTIGEIIFLTGLAGAPLGLVMTGIANSNDDCDRAQPGFVTAPSEPCHSYQGLRDAGITISIVGLASMAAGAILYMTSSKSEAIQTRGVAARARVHFFPLPTFSARIEQPVFAMPMPSAHVEPLFAVTF